MKTIYKYYAECDKCGPISGLFDSFAQAEGVANNHNANVHKHVREAYPVTHEVNIP